MMSLYMIRKDASFSLQSFHASYLLHSSHTLSLLLFHHANILPFSFASRLFLTTGEFHGWADAYHHGLHGKYP